MGVAAGFDKDAQAIDGLFDLGFGYVEVGSVTPVPQAGNPKPRFFRLEEDEAAINRYGFNSLGHGQTLAQLRSRLVRFAQEHPTLFPNPSGSPLPPDGLPRSLRPGHILGVNLGKNKTSPADSNEDYIKGVRLLGPYADVIVINVSSPNTPGLRALQGAEELERLLSDVKAEREKIVQNGLPKIAVKVTCDLSEEGLADVAAAVRKTGIDGVIISNTTLRREGLQSGELVTSLTTNNSQRTRTRSAACPAARCSRTPSRRSRRSGPSCPPRCQSSARAESGQARTRSPWRAPARPRCRCTRRSGTAVSARPRSSRTS